MADTTTPLYAFVQPEVGASTDTWGGKENTDLLQIEQEIARQRIPFLSPAVGPTTTLDMNQTSGARVFQFTVSQITTVAITNVPSASWFERILLKITNGAAFAVTWPAAFDWEGGSAPTLSASGVDWVEAFTLDGGVTWYAQVVHYNAIATSVVNVRRLKANGPFALTNSGEVSLDSLAVPANTLILNGDTLRVTVHGIVTVGNATVRVKFGSIVVADFIVTGAVFKIVAHIARSALNAQRSNADLGFGSSSSMTRTLTSETETSPITLDLRAAAVGSNNLTVDNWTVELIKA